MIGVSVFAVCFFKGDVLSSLFTSDPDVIAASFAYLRGFVPESIVTAVLFSLLGYLNGYQRTVWTMVQGLLQTFVVRIPFAYVMSMRADASLTAIGLASPLASLFGVVLNLFYLSWFRRHVLKGEQQEA